MSITLVHMLLASPLPHAHTGQCPSAAQAKFLLLPGQILSCLLLTMAENRQQQQSLKMPHHCPCQREVIRRLNKKSSVKAKNWTESKKKQGYISERHFRGGGAAEFVWTQEQSRVCCFSAGQSPA